MGGITIGLTYKSLKKDNQKKFPLQVPYHIKVSLQEYYENFREWPIPDFSDKCLICGGVGCACFHGVYIRTVVCPITGFSAPDLPVLRYICNKRGNNITCDHVTFSLLPFMLAPYHRLPLQFMVQVMWIKVSRHLSLTKTLEVVEKELNHLEDIVDCISVTSITSWEKMILAALSLFLSTDIHMISTSQYKKLQVTKGLNLFLEIIINYQSEISNHSIRGPDVFAWDFYQKSGGTDECAFFLFALTSQHRI